MRRFPLIGHVFHHTLADIDGLELHHWVQLAHAADEYVDETKKQRSRWRR